MPVIANCMPRYFQQNKLCEGIAIVQNLTVAVQNITVLMSRLAISGRKFIGMGTAYTLSRFRFSIIAQEKMKNLFKNNLVLDLGSKVSKFRINNGKPCLEPTTVATLLRGNRIKTLIGNEAVAWPHPVFHSINPFLSGVVSDSKCFDYFLQGIRKKAKKLVPLYRCFLPWSYTIIIHGGMTKLEKEAIANGGLPNCLLIESHELFKGDDELILDLGASTSTVVAFNAGRQIGHEIESSGSNNLSNAIKSFIQNEYSCTILSKSTERLKCTSEKVHEVKGHHVVKKTPMRITVSADEIQKVIDDHNNSHFGVHKYSLKCL